MMLRNLSDERFALNATSMLCRSKYFGFNFYQKNPRVMPSSFKNIFEALNTIPPGSIKSKRTFGVTGFYTIKFGLFIAYFSKIGTRRKR